VSSAERVAYCVAYWTGEREFASRLRLRPILMTSLATVLGLIPMAMKPGTGSEAYAPLARAIIGGLLVSVVVTVYLVPAAYLIVHRGKEQPLQEVHS